MSLRGLVFFCRRCWSSRSLTNLPAGQQRVGGGRTLAGHQIPQRGHGHCGHLSVRCGHWGVSRAGSPARGSTSARSAWGAQRSCGHMASCASQRGSALPQVPPAGRWHQLQGHKCIDSEEASDPPRWTGERVVLARLFSGNFQEDLLGESLENI